MSVYAAPLRDMRFVIEDVVGLRRHHHRESLAAEPVHKT